MARKELDSTEWADVDQAQDTGHYVGYLDRVSAIEVVKSYKRQTYNLMEIEAGHCVLDLGCGSGDDVFNLAEMVGSSGQAIGIDNSEAMITEARKRTETSNLSVEFRVGDIYRLDEADGTFDSCRADRVFQHLIDPQRALAEMVRVTRVGGRVVIFDVDWETLVVDTPNAPLTRRVVNLISDDHLNGWAGRQLFGYCKQAGLNDLVVVPTTAIISDYALANQIFELSPAAEALQKVGQVSASQVTAWIHALKQADKIGQFFSTLTGYSVSGRKPG